MAKKVFCSSAAADPFQAHWPLTFDYDIIWQSMPLQYSNNNGHYGRLLWGRNKSKSFAPKLPRLRQITVLSCRCGFRSWICGYWKVTGFFFCECCILRNLLSRTISSEGATHSQAQWDLFRYKLKLRVLNRERKCTQFICLLASDRFISHHVRNDDKILWCWNKIWTGSLDGSWMIM